MTNNALKIIVAVYLIFCTIPFSLAQNFQTLEMQFTGIIKQAIKFEKQGDIKQSNKLYLKAHKIFPDRFEAIYGLAKTYGWLDYDEAAFKYYQETLSKAPDNIDVLESYAAFLRDNKQYNDALKIYIKLQNLTNKHKYIKNLAELFFLQGNYNKSLELYIEAYSRNPEDTEIQRQLALLYFIQGDFKKSNLFYQSYLSRKIDSESFLNYGKSLFYSGNPQKARCILEEYTRTYPPRPDVYETLGEIYLNQKEFDKALSAFNQAIQLKPDDTQLRLKLGMAYIALKNYGQAKNILLQLKSLEPQNPVILENLGDIYFYSSDFAYSLNYYICAFNIKPSTELTFKMAQSYHFSGNINNAENLYKNLVQIPEFKIRGLLGLGQINIIKANYKTAKSYFEQVLILAPGNQEAQAGIATIYIAEGNNLKAITMLNNLEQRDNVRYQLALAYTKIRRYDLALKALENNSVKESNILKNEINTEIKPKLEPIFALFDETGNANQLKYQRYGGRFFANPKPNYTLNSAISATPYSSLDDNAETTSTLYSAGLAGKPTNNLQFDSNIGIDDLSNNTQQVLGNVNINIIPNDTINFNIGYIRNKIEYSLLSAAGLRPIVGPFAGLLVGRTADNKFLSNISVRLPHRSYTYAGYNLGYVRGKNIPANPYQEGTAGIGSVVFSRPVTNLLNQIETGYGLYVASFKDDRSGYGGADLRFTPLGSDGISPDPFPGNPGIGGYFSPNFILNNRFLLNFRGNISKIKLKYLLNGYIGTSNIREANLSSGTSTRLNFGGKAALGINEDGRVGLRTSYQIDNFQLVTQQLFLVNLILRF